MMKWSIIGFGIGDKNLAFNIETSTSEIKDAIPVDKGVQIAGPLFVVFCIHLMHCFCVHSTLFF